MPSLPEPDLLGGLDLGQMADYTAFALVGREYRDEGGVPVAHYAVRNLHRWPLRTSYADIVDDVVRLYSDSPVAGSALVVDRTGAGMAVVDHLRRAGPNARLVPALITGGAGSSASDEGWSVAKRELAGTLQVLLGTRRLQVVPSLPLAGALTQEMATFKVKINLATGNESFEAWREKDHDDLVLAVALACWFAESHPPFVAPKAIPNPRPRNPFAGPWPGSAQERLRARFEGRRGRR
jgi:hypothetical protein